MCKLVNEKEITDWDKRCKQIARWGEILDIERSGHKFIINGINDNHKEEQSDTNQRNIKYQKDGTTLILDYIAGKPLDKGNFWLDENKFILNNTYAYKHIGFCNENFVSRFNLKANNECSKVISKGQKRYFRSNITKSLKSNLKSILGKLVNDGYVIKVEEMYFVLEKKGVRRIANEEELKQIEDCKEMLFKIIGVTKESEIVNCKTRSVFYNDLNNKLRQSIGTIRYVYKNYILELNIDYLSKVKTRLDEEERLVLRERINRLFLDSKKKSISKAIAKNIQKQLDKQAEKPCELKHTSRAKFSIDINSVSDEYVIPDDHQMKWELWLETFIDASIHIEEERKSLLNEEEEEQIDPAIEEEWNLLKRKREYLFLVHKHQWNLDERQEIRSKRARFRRYRKVLPALQALA